MAAISERSTRRDADMTKKRVSSELYLASRTARDLEAVESGNPKRIVRRVKNRVVGRLVARLLRGVWR